MPKYKFYIQTNKPITVEASTVKQARDQVMAMAAKSYETFYVTEGLDIEKAKEKEKLRKKKKIERERIR